MLQSTFDIRGYRLGDLQGEVAEVLGAGRKLGWRHEVRFHSKAIAGIVWMRELAAIGLSGYWRWIVNISFLKVGRVTANSGNRALKDLLPHHAKQ